MLRILTCLLLAIALVQCKPTSEDKERLSKFFSQDEGLEEDKGTRWAVLIAGSTDWFNYRHQADVCHAYQLLKQGGLKDENIIVFMWDDIAECAENPHRGKIFNRPNGPDVYEGVVKDYTKSSVNTHNFLAALSGNKSALTGDNSGKVLEAGPNDHVFIYYSDHGSTGALGMPGGMLFANDLIEVLKKRHEAGGYKSLVFYLEACESGSIFQGLLPETWNIYAVTAANATESSYATYCPAEGDDKPEFDTCLGDLFSVAWMEDTEQHDRSAELLSDQYVSVRDRTKGDSSD